MADLPRNIWGGTIRSILNADPALRPMVDDGAVWWACEHPERPYAIGCNLHLPMEATPDGCRGCILASEAAYQAGRVSATIRDVVAGDAGAYAVLCG